MMSYVFQGWHVHPSPIWSRCVQERTVLSELSVSKKSGAQCKILQILIWKKKSLALSISHINSNIRELPSPFLWFSIANNWCSVYQQCVYIFVFRWEQNHQIPTLCTRIAWARKENTDTEIRPVHQEGWMRTLIVVLLSSHKRKTVIKWRGSSLCTLIQIQEKMSHSWPFMLRILYSTLQNVKAIFRKICGFFLLIWSNVICRNNWAI